MSTDTVQLSPGQRLTVISSTPAALQLESSWDPAGTPPRRHFHPHQVERFEVLEGELTVELGTEPSRAYGVGEVLEVPAGVSHRMWNPSDRPTRASWRVSPGMRTEEMFRFIDAGLGPLRSVAMLVRFRREFRLG
ncbi:cupin domain-containing protein [Propionibacteriaceae bacterium Y2011]|uniref:cupin domain-containing protein n=1 Tax=Microlunatus sp. Y2014 TaxID=3418488 RepID=UPI003B47893E